MFTAEERMEWLRQGFEDLQAEGEIWVEMPEVTRRAMTHVEGYMHRRHAVNRVLNLVGIHRPDMPKKAPYQYRNIEASMAIQDMEELGELEHKFLDHDTGELFTPPPPELGVPSMKLDYRDRRYRLLPATVELELPAAAGQNGPVRRLPSPPEPYAM